MPNARRLPRRIVLAGVCLALVVAFALPAADARLDPKTWREVQSDAEQLFGQIGEREAKARVVGLLLEDNDRRSWRVLVDGLVKEAEAWVTIAKQIEEKVQQIDAVESKPMAKRYPEEQRHLVKWKEDLGGLEFLAREQRASLDDITLAVAGGPEALRQNLFRTAKGAGAWPVRAAAARVAAMNPEEKLSFEYLTRAMAGDKDPRVRMAGLEALRTYVAKDDAAAEGVPPPEPGKEGEEEGEKATPDILTTAEGLILGRLADGDWGVQLLAVRIVEEQKLTKAIPHLISGLSFAGPRVREAIGTVLRDFTGENFDAYADVWGKWWEDNKEKFASEERVKAGKTDRPPSDMHFYGLPVKSDRILFIIDASSSMKLPTQYENPAEKWKPKAPVTGPDAGPPPPPPPEEILSGPKIDVAKHELKKAIQNLPESSLFNIIAFNSAVLKWQDTMMEASSKNKKDALTWVRALEPKGSTYIDGALRLAFRIAGIGAIDQKYADVNVDTMVLLSDGAPTDDGYPDAKFMDPEIILEHVREWNQHRRIVIHCIGVDMVTSIEFLEKLAAENGGEYVDR